MRKDISVVLKVEWHKLWRSDEKGYKCHIEGGVVYIREKKFCGNIGN